MSMVIMNAWKTPFKNLQEIVDWAISFRSKMSELADDKFNNLVTNFTLNTIDYIFKNKTIPEKTITTLSNRYSPAPLNPDYSLIWQIEMETSMAIKYETLSTERNSMMDFRSEMVFIPYDGEIYAIWYGDDRDWEKYLSTLGWEEYWYDGRTDEGDVPYKEYQKRGEIWSKIFDKVNSSSEAGVVVDLLASKYYRYNKQEINEERRKKIIEIYVNDHALYEFWLNLNDNKLWAEEKIKTNGPFSVYDEYRKWARTEGKDKKQFLIKEYSQIYPSVEKINQYFSMKPIDILKDLEE